MKNTILLVTALLLGLTAYGQHETIFGDATVVGGFGGPIFEFGINSNVDYSAGGGGGVIVDNFFLGGYGLASIDFNALLNTGDIERIELAHGGIWAGFTVQPFRIVHLYVNGRIGWGGVNIDLQSNGYNSYSVDRVFVGTPEVGVELNVARWFRLAVAGGYRFVNGISSTGPFSKDYFNGATLSVGLRFGYFGWDRY